MYIWLPQTTDQDLKVRTSISKSKNLSEFIDKDHLKGRRWGVLIPYFFLCVPRTINENVCWAVYVRCGNSSNQLWLDANETCSPSMQLPIKSDEVKICANIIQVFL